MAYSPPVMANYAGIKKPAAAPAPVKPVTQAPATNLYQQDLRKLGYTGDFGGGKANAWLASNPAMQQKASAQYTAREKGYTGDFGGGGYNAWTQQQAQPPAPQGEGVVPVGVVEELNPWQKNVLGQMYGGMPSAQDFQWGMGLLRDANTTAQGLNTTFPQAAASYMNPYETQAINAMASDVMRQTDLMKPQLRNTFSDAGAFGSDREGVAIGMLGDAATREIANNAASMRNTGYNNAASIFNADQGRRAQLAGIQSGLSGQALGAYNTAQNRALFAGDRVQEEGQKLADAATAERERAKNYEWDVINKYLQVLGAFPTTGNAQVPQTVNPIQGALGGFLAGGSLQDAFGGGADKSLLLNPQADSSLPWSSWYRG